MIISSEPREFFVSNFLLKFILFSKIVEKFSISYETFEG